VNKHEMSVYMSINTILNDYEQVNYQT